MTWELPWDPEIESPATIAILGGGPVGIEAAIYGRFLGYFVCIFESRRVGHRMLDWHHRPLCRTASEITTSLGHAAIASQNPDYQRPDPERIFTGREYAEEYLIPLAKTDLLFDDIHFLSPVVDVSRLRTHRDDPIDPQERCNDEFRIVVQGRHRGPWIARADCVIDCRGVQHEEMGIGPGGGMAIGEREVESQFFPHAPEDRKFERKMLDGKRLTLIGQSPQACLCAEEFVRHFPPETGSRLTWVVRPRGDHDTETFLRTYNALQANSSKNLVLMEALGVEAISQLETGEMRLRLLKEDDSTVELDSDLVMRRTGHRYCSVGHALHEYCNHPMGFSRESIGSEVPDFITAEPGYYRVHAGSLDEGPGAGIPGAIERIRQIYALLGGRRDLDLYSIIDRQSHGDPSSA